MRHAFASLAALAFTATAAFAQWQVPSGNVPTGKGPGVAGFGSVAPGAGKVLGGSPLAATSTPTLGVPGSVLGSLTFSGNTSGSVLLRPQSVAGGSPVTVQLPQIDGKLALDYSILPHIPTPTSNDTTQFQGALDAVDAAGGGTLFCPTNAQYTIEAVTIGSNTTLRDCNIKQRTQGTRILDINGKTNVKLINNTITGTLASGAGLANPPSNDYPIRIRGSSTQVAVIGNKITRFGLYAIYAENSTNLQIDRNTIFENAFGVWLRGTSLVTVSNNNIKHTALYSLTPTSNQLASAITLDSTDGHAFGVNKYVSITGNAIEDFPYSQAIFGHAGINVTVTGNVAKNVSTCISFNPFNATDTMDYLSIVGNSCEATLATTLPGDQADNGIFVQGGGSTPIIKNTVIANNSLHAFNRVDPDDQHGCIVVGYTSGTSVTGNSMEGCGGNGIVMVDREDGAVVSSNAITNVVLADGVQYGIRWLGTLTNSARAVQVGNMVTNLTDASAVAFRDEGTGANLLCSGNFTYNVTAVGCGTSTALVVGASVITGGTADRILYNNAGVLGEYTRTGTPGSVVMSNSPSLVTPNLGTPSAVTLTNATGLPVATGISGLGTNVAAFLATASSANLRAALTDEVGTGAAYFVGGALGTPASGTATNLTGLPISTGLTGAGTGVLTALGVNIGSAGAPVLFNGAGGTPSSLTLTNATGLPISGITGLGSNVGTFLATPSSANLASALTDETGSGAAVFAASPTLTGTITAAAANFSGTITFGTGTITGLVNKASPNSTDDYVVIYDHAGTAVKKATVGSVAAGAAVSSVGGQTGAIGVTSPIAMSGSNIIFSPAAATTTTTTATCGTGSLTGGASVNWRYWVFGKIVYFTATFNPAYSSCTSHLILPLPTGTSAATQMVHGGDGTAVRALIGFIGSSATAINVFRYDGTFPSGASGNSINVSGFYEIS